MVAFCAVVSWPITFRFYTSLIVKRHFVSFNYSVCMFNTVENVATRTPCPQAVLIIFNHFA